MQIQDPLSATYDDLLQQLNRGIIPEGFKGKSGCKVCHGGGTMLKQIGFDEKTGKAVTARVGCMCIERQIRKEYQQERKKLATASSTPAEPAKKEVRPPSRKTLQRRDRLQQTVDTRRGKLERAEGLVATLEEQVALGTVELRNKLADQEADLANRRAAIDHAAHVREELEATVREINKQLVRVDAARVELVDEVEQLEVGIKRTGAEIEQVKAQRAGDLHRARLRVQDARKLHDTSNGKLQALIRMIDAGNA